MASQLTPQQFIKAIDPDKPMWYNAGENLMPSKFDQVFEIKRSNQAWETIASSIDIGLLQQKPTATPTRFDKLAQGPSKQYMHQSYAIALSISEELIEDSLAFDFAEKSVMAIGDAARRTKETICALVLNQGFSATPTNGLVCPDGVNLLSASHPSPVGNISNILTNPSDLNYAALETLYKQLPSITDDRGNLIELQLDQLVIPRTYAFVAKRILDSVNQPGTANNDINAVKAMNIVPRGAVVWDYINVNSKAWFAKTSQKILGLTLYMRKDLKDDMDKDFSTGGVLMKGAMRLMPVVGNYRSIVGSPGV